MIGSLITWILAIGAIAIAVVSLLKNFSREGPPGEEGPPGKPGVDGEATMQDITEQIELLQTNLQNGNIVVSQATNATDATNATNANKLKQDGVFKDAQNLKVNDSTKLNGQLASYYAKKDETVSTTSNYRLKLKDEKNIDDKRVYLGFGGGTEGFGGDSANNRYAVFHNNPGHYNTKFELQKV